jgi:hypothetical protein
MQRVKLAAVPAVDAANELRQRPGRDIALPNLAWNEVGNAEPVPGVLIVVMRVDPFTLAPPPGQHARRRRARLSNRQVRRDVLSRVRNWRQRHASIARQHTSDQ